MRCIGFAFLSAAIGLGATPARAQSDAESIDGQTLSANADLRLVGVDGERSWLDGGYGKARFGDHGDLRVRPYAVEGDVVWHPRISWALTGTAVAIAQRGQQHAVDLSEAYLTYKPLMPGATKLSARGGLFWPPVSLEHGGGDWRVLDTITPSAINSWIGEEVKVGGAEATVSVPLGGSSFALTAAIFGFNDTAGTLLAFRGWALHDEKATAFGLQRLPPLDPFWTGTQASRTRPVAEIDSRPGYYVKASWSPSSTLRFDAFHYDNRGDPEAVTSRLQWGWDTRFDNLGATISLGRVTLKSQALAGRTRMGFPQPDALWVNTRFHAAYLLATAAVPEGSVTLRGEAFGTRNRGSIVDRGYDEDGWALTAALRHEFGRHVTGLAEIVHIDSKKDEREETGLASRQHQTQGQVAVRLHL